MDYKVINRFIDSADDNKVYEVGDTFKGTKKRLEELSSDKNKAGFPVIEEVPEKKAKAKKKETKGSK